MVAITTTGITNYFYCVIIVSQSSSLFILRSEGDWCVLALNISNIGLGFTEIMQLACVASWLAGFLYKQVLLGIFQMNSLVIIKCLFDLEITYENKNASTEIQQSLLNDNFTMHTSCSIVRCVYNHIEIQSKTLLNLQLFLCIVSRQMEAEYIAKFSIWIIIFLLFYLLLLLLLFVNVY